MPDKASTYELVINMIYNAVCFVDLDRGLERIKAVREGALMAITFFCSGCGQEFSVPESRAGQTAGCRGCGNRIVVPGRKAAPKPVRRARPERFEGDEDIAGGSMEVSSGFNPWVLFAGIVGIGTVVIVILAFVFFLGSSEGGSSTAGNSSLAELPGRFSTQLVRRGPSPFPWKDEVVPNTDLILYSSEKGLRLKAWVGVPQNDKSKARPAIVFLHGGFAFGASDFEDCHMILNSGFVVMCPSYRGENGNPGHFELMAGEVEDAVSSIKWLAQQPYVDKSRIYVFGHSAGGGLAALISLRPDAPVRHTGSSGGLYSDTVFFGWDFSPFNVNNARERKARILLGRLELMKHPHFAYLGSSDSFYAEGSQGRAEAKSKSAPLTVIDVSGDHFTALAPSLQRYLAEIQSNR